MANDRELPSVPSAVRRSLRLAYRAEPRLLVISFALLVGAWIPDALAALWLKVLVDGIGAGDRGSIFTACAGLAASAGAGWVLRTVGNRIELRFRDRATIAIEAHVAHLQASVPTIELHERPEFLDRLQLLRDGVFLLNHVYASLMNMVGAVGRLVITTALLVSVHPLLVFLGLFAVPVAVVSAKRATVERETEERAAPHRRAAKHLFDLGTTAGSAKELRVSGSDRDIVERRRAAWQGWYGQVAHVRWVSAAFDVAAWVVFGSAYVAAIVFVASGIDASPGDVLLVLAAGSRLSQYVGATVGQTEFLRWTIDAAQRMAWLEDFADRHRQSVDAEVPDRLVDGIRLDGVSFAYPGTDREVLEGVDLHLPAGSVVAIVGENGAGKSTLVKLLCALYDPTAGKVTVDGTDLRRLDPVQWRQRVAGAFQDFFRFEFAAGRTVGVGDLDRVDDRPAVETAVDRAGAGDVVGILPRGLDTQLGPTWADGTDLSFGQWQKLALARGFMRDRPLLCVLDEPTAALDAETEHALFERFAAAARASRDDGRVTVLVSHRFSTVRMADLIVVLDGNRVVEVGSHAALIGRNGLYAELYGLQAAAYR